MLFPSKFTKLLFGDESVKVLNRYVDFKKFILLLKCEFHTFY